MANIIKLSKSTSKLFAIEKIKMYLKESFLASLSDEQLGFFCAHEYNENLADMLQDEINVIQYQLFEKWKEHEKRIVAQNPVPSPSQPDFTDKISQLFEMFAERIEAKMEEKIKALEESYSEKLVSVAQQIAQVTESQQQQSDKLVEATERQQQHSDKLIQSSISDVKQKFDKSEQHLTKLEGSISQQFAYIKQKIEESEKHLAEKIDQLAEKVFDCIKNSSDWKLLNEGVEVIGNNTLTTPNMTVKEATEWIEEIGNKLLIKRYECITENTVTKIIGIMKKFENNKSIVRKGIIILELMARNSDMTIHYITNTHGGIENLMKLFKNSYRNNDLYRILFRIAECKETQKKLMKSEYLSSIFERLSKVQYPPHILYSSIILSHLLDFSEDSFPVNITKNMIESKIIERFPLLSTDYIYSYMLPHDYSWCLERIINGTKAQKYVCANIFATYYSYSKKLIEDIGAIPVLERVASDANTNDFVKMMVNEALRTVKR